MTKTAQISEREKELLHLLSMGLTQQEIAYRTGVHINTVHAIVTDLKIKLDCGNLFQLGMCFYTWKNEISR